MNVNFRVFGTPAAQGSKRWLPNGRMIEADKKIKPWRASVYEAINQTCNSRDWIPLEGPISVRVVFLFERPKHHYGSKAGVPYLKASAPRFKVSVPDVDKCLRALLDPITEMKVWGDDSQVVIAHAVKRYCNDGERPGAVVTITDSITPVGDA